MTNKVITLWTKLNRSHLFPYSWNWIMFLTRIYMLVYPGLIICLLIIINKTNSWINDYLSQFWNVLHWTRWTFLSKVDWCKHSNHFSKPLESNELNYTIAPTCSRMYTTLILCLSLDSRVIHTRYMILKLCSFYL